VTGLQSPNLDDRDFEQIVGEAVRLLKERFPRWDDSLSNPGMVLVDVFAYLTESLGFRLNRVPDKNFIEFLRLLGVKLQPPSAASTTLRFHRERNLDRDIEIQAGTRVTVGSWRGDSPPPIFRTLADATLASGQESVDVAALHFEPVEAELASLGTGLPGQLISVQRPPIIAPTGDEADLIVAVEATPDELDETRRPARRENGKDFLIWSEVQTFGETEESDAPVYVVDRSTGVITFAPAARWVGTDGGLEDQPQAAARVPAKGREIRVWYRCGGGDHGNLAQGMLDTLKDAIPGLEVTNPARATGGHAEETVENALIRGPEEFHRLQRAVTASDYVHFARSEAGVARAHAFSKSSVWHFAPVGTVSVRLVPELTEELRSQPLRTHLLESLHAADRRERIQKLLDEKSPLGTSCEVSWVRYKTVRVQGKIIVHSEEDRRAVAERVGARLNQLIHPLPQPPMHDGWEFGRPLHVFQVYDIGIREPGVKRVEKVELLVDEAPTDAADIACDPFQSKTWYAASGDTLYRSVNAGEGWEVASRFEGEKIRRVVPCEHRAGLIGIVTRVEAKAEPAEEGDEAAGASESDGHSVVHISWDCGSTSEVVLAQDWAIRDLEWVERGGEPRLFIAGKQGLREMGVRPKTAPNLVVVDPTEVERELQWVTSGPNARGVTHVAVAGGPLQGVWVSGEGGRSDSFKHIGLKDVEIGALRYQNDGDRTRFWAGVQVAVSLRGKGCRSWDFTEGEPAESWREWAEGFEQAGACTSLSFKGPEVYAGSFERGVLRLARPTEGAAWTEPAPECGLPRPELDRFDVVECVAVDASDGTLMAGGARGVYCSRDGGARYDESSKTTFEDRVTLPPTWLFCPGEHQIEVTSDDEES
jgi:hypothetical protein